MDNFDQLDSFFKKEDQEIAPLEVAARLCMVRAQNSKTIAAALIAQNCSIDIRNLPDWKLYQNKVTSFKLPQHKNAEPHKRVMANLHSLSPKEIYLTIKESQK